MFDSMLSDVKKSRAYQEIAEEAERKAERKIEQKVERKVERKKTHEFARVLLRKKMPFAFISEVTGLSAAELRVLKRELAQRKN